MLTILTLLVACESATITIENDTLRSEPGISDTSDTSDTDDSGDPDEDTIPDVGVGSDDVDDDGDGYTENDGDCDDLRASAHPGADEVWYNGIDEDCLDGSDYDQDGDGEDSQAVLGVGSTDYSDCDDDGDGFNISPCYRDSNGNGVFDNDPNVQVEAVITLENPDCDDTDPGRFPTNPEIVGNEYDENCDGLDELGIEIEWPNTNEGTLFLTVTGDAATDFIILGPGSDFQVLTLSDSIEEAATYLAAFEVVTDGYSPGQDETNLGDEAAAGEVGYLLRTASDIYSVGSRCVVWGPYANQFDDYAAAKGWGCVDITAHMSRPNSTDYTWDGLY